MAEIDGILVGCLNSSDGLSRCWIVNLEALRGVGVGPAVCRDV